MWGNCVVNGVATLSCIPTLVANVLSAALAFGGITATAFIIWGGFKYIRSGGDPKQADNARQTITYAIIGLIIVMLAYFILSFISKITNLPCLGVFDLQGCQDKTSWVGCFYDATTIPEATCIDYKAGQEPSNPLHWYSGPDHDENFRVCNDIDVCKDKKTPY